jgi:Flp pilus assembly pilin Flp
MKTIASFFRDFHADDSGAAFIEYTALLGVILAVGLATLGLVGTWVGGIWEYLCDNLPAVDTVVACNAGGA